MPASGPQLCAFRSGWAFPIFAGNKGHHFRRVGLNEFAASACGLVYPVANLYGIGTFPSCRICRKKAGAPPNVRTFIDAMPPAQLAGSPVAQMIAAAIAREDHKS